MQFIQQSGSIFSANQHNDVSDFAGLSIDAIALLPEEYSEEELSGIFEALRWATKNPGYDFRSLLPDLRHSNGDIYQYLCKIEVSLEKYYPV
ncbi:hypothetical protein H8L32_07535 [Undibacterium sp. CY18W]|uniref:Uncharacterized protein n=1 Tax=Undibacterium hunanense TaxID=2762292 RepID=A0ABR6ZN85_9BURK|nr:hypothetical protein [Undibacterium hunanense]MBC3917322.1 hypothetical protein [Undibacterium hunanense]